MIEVLLHDIAVLRRMVFLWLICLVWGAAVADAVGCADVRAFQPSWWRLVE